MSLLNAAMLVGSFIVFIQFVSCFVARRYGYALIAGVWIFLVGLSALGADVFGWLDGPPWLQRQTIYSAALVVLIFPLTAIYFGLRTKMSRNRPIMFFASAIACLIGLGFISFRYSIAVS